MTGQLPPRGTPTRLRAGHVLACLVLGVTASGASVSAAASAPRPGVSEKPAGRAFICAAPAPSPAFRVLAQAPALEGLTPPQVSRLSALTAMGHQRELPARAQGIALMTALAQMSDSMSPERFGTTVSKLDPDEFYSALEATRRWQELPPSVVGHRIFKTADPYAFEDYWVPAVTLLADLSRKPSDKVKVAVSPGAEAPSGCAPDGRAREFPLPAGTGYRMINPDRGAQSVPTNSERTATATLLSAPCGTPVLSANSGTVHIASGVPEAGPWLLEVRNEKTGETTSYAHVAKPLVNEGEIVGVGRPLATVGDFGSVAGCALGFGVKSQKKGELSQPQAASWLRATQLPPIADEPVTPPEPGPTTFRFATFNVLGSHLTGPGNDRPHFGPGPIRMSQALAKIESLQASVVVFNEFESPAANVVLADPDWRLFRATGNNVFRDGNSAGNAIAWRDDTWALVAATEFTVPWQVTLHMPVVTLRNRVTGGEVVVVGVHNPASTARQGNQSGSRGLARTVELAQIADIMEQTGLPVILGGDMNERAEALCGFTRDSLLTTFTGGAPTCSGYGYGGVDFIFGGGDLGFLDRVIDRSTLGQVSDHPLVSSAIVLNP